MKNIIPATLVNFIARQILTLTVISAAIFPGSTSTAYAEAEPSLDSCGQLLADAEARFLSTLPEDGSVPVTPETEAAAQEYIRVSKLCYEELEAQNLAGDAHEGTPAFIDHGGVIMESESSAQFTTTGHKWGPSTWGTSGDTVTYSFMGNGLSLSAEPYSSGFGSSVAISSLPGFQACFITEIRNAFAAWQAVSNIQFVQVTDSGSAFNAPGAGGDIRIGAHTFDGPSGVLAHAYYPPPNGGSAAGDMHFDRQENWTCNTSGIDIGVVALHEIGHSLGLGHETTSTLAVMDPYYNPSLTNLQSDDVNGATFIYGASQLVAPSNDDIDSATVITSIAFTDSLNVIDATEAVDDPDGINPCSSTQGNKNLNAGWKTVWYRYTPQAVESISLDTLGSNYDTFIAVWTGTRGALNLVQCNEDTFEAVQSELSFVGVPSTTYHIQIGEFSGLDTDLQPKPRSSYGGLEFHAYITNTNVNIGTALMGRYYVQNGTSLRRSFASIDNGPVRVNRVDNTSIIAAIRAVWSMNGVYSSYSEMMGLPKEQLSTEYYFPWYNNTTNLLDEQFRIGNVDTTATTIEVSAGGNTYTYPLPAGQSIRVAYPLDTGPVRIRSLDGKKIIAAMRAVWSMNGVYSSYSELMGLPKERLSTEYYFPWYNNAYPHMLDEQLRFGVP